MRTKTRSTEESIVGEADPKTIKRAAWEAFEFELEAPRLIRVSNGSYENPEDHSYLINIETDTPVACECKAFECSDGPCKHMVAVAIREPVLKAAQSELVADGGQDLKTCQNGQEGCYGPNGDELPCFECSQENQR